MKRSSVFKGGFSAAHLYNVASWTPEQNTRSFGRCYSEHGHGHNYQAAVTFTNLPQDLMSTAQAEVAAVCDGLEHTHLNFDIAFFKNKNPTTEMITLYFHEELGKRPQIASYLAKIKIMEIEGLWSELILEGG